MQIGVTGGIGSGKSLVCKIFNSMGIPIYEADFRAKELTNKDEVVKEKILTTFGKKSFLNNRLNKVYLAQEVFNNTEKLKQLNAIIHPAVADDYDIWQSQFKNYKYVIKEAAILFESGSFKTCDKVILVDAPRNIRMKRVIQRDLVSEDEVEKRMNNQWSSEKKAELSDFIIMNDGSKALIPQVMDIHNKLMSI